MRRLISCIVGFCMTAVILPSASGAVPSVLSVQGRITDSLGTPPSAGPKNFTFRIYDSDVNGTKQWPAGPGEVQSLATSTEGFWSAHVGAVEPLTESVFAGTARWLEIEVDGTTLPRLRIVAGAYAFRVATVDGADGGRLNSALGIPALDLGSPSQGGQAQLYRNGSITPTILLDGSGANGGSIQVRDEAGNRLLRLEPDGNGSGGCFGVSRTPTVEGFFVDGNADGTNEPRVSITGSVRSATFDLGQSGNSSVTLPSDAIASAEILDEPGVASNDRHAEYILTGVTDVLTSRTLTVPADGYILAIATGEVISIHVNGTSCSGQFGLSDNPDAFMSVQNLTQIPSAAPTGTYRVALAANNIFPVSAGSNTIYLLGLEISGNLRASDLELSLLFVPTAYGTVDPPAAAGGTFRHMDRTSNMAADHGSVGESEIARLTRELTALRAEFDVLKKQVAVHQVPNQPAALPRR